MGLVVGGREGIVFEDGAYVVKRGETGDCLYVVQSGELEVVLGEVDNGEPKVVKTLTAGDFFGEISIFAHQRRTASVRASGGARVARITASELNAWIEKNPQIAAFMLKKLSLRVVELSNLVEELWESGASRPELEEIEWDFSL